MLEEPFSAARHDIGGFKKFLLRGNVVDLAVGVVIGAAFGSVVQSFVKDLLNPLIGVAGGSSSLSDATVTIGASQFAVGDFLNALISFVLIATVVYFAVVVPMNHLRDRFEPQPQPAPTKECPECTSRIPERARRCPQCTAELALNAPPRSRAA